MDPYRIRVAGGIPPLKERRTGSLAVVLLAICLLAVGVHSCAVNPVTGRSELRRWRSRPGGLPDGL